MDFVINVINAVLEVSGVKGQVARSEYVLNLRKKFGLDSISQEATFEDVYAFAVMEYATNEEGLCKPRALVEFLS